jgi:hypothetical protein
MIFEDSRAEAEREGHLSGDSGVCMTRATLFVPLSLSAFLQVNSTVLFESRLFQLLCPATPSLAIVLLLFIKFTASVTSNATLFVFLKVSTSFEGFFLCGAYLNAFLLPSFGSIFGCWVPPSSLHNAVVHSRASPLSNCQASLLREIWS